MRCVSNLLAAPISRCRWKRSDLAAACLNGPIVPDTGTAGAGLVSWHRPRVQEVAHAPVKAALLTTMSAKRLAGKSRNGRAGLTTFNHASGAASQRDSDDTGCVMPTLPLPPPLQIKLRMLLAGWDALPHAALTSIVHAIGAGRVATPCGLTHHTTRATRAPLRLGGPGTAFEDHVLSGSWEPADAVGAASLRPVCSAVVLFFATI